MEMLLVAQVSMAQDQLALLARPEDPRIMDISTSIRLRRATPRRERVDLRSQ